MFKAGTDIVRGIVDVAHKSARLLNPSPNVSAASNVTLMHLNRGVPFNEVVVPIYSGQQWLFVPVCEDASSLVSHVLHATDDTKLLEIARLFSCIEVMNRRPLVF